MSKTKIGKKFTKKEAAVFRENLLEWYDRHARALPWRYTKNQQPDPYKVWLSEIMLQQTTVAAVAPYFLKFTQKWPSVKSLAAAPQDEIMHEWAGLGYYSRARNLYKCAQIVAGELKGIFPQDQSELKKLPGIGDYTSAAIRAIAFNQPATVVDGNVERIMARYFAVQTPMPEAKQELKEIAGGLFENYTERPGDLAQALMDHGATICIPKSPRCSLCPVSRKCEAKKLQIAAELPRQLKQKPKPQKIGHVYWITNAKGDVLIDTRPPNGMLGGMKGLPTSDWIEKSSRMHKLVGPKGSRKISNFTKNPASIKHSFTHFDLELVLKKAVLPENLQEARYSWIPLKDMQKTGFPTVFKKAARLYLAGHGS